MATETHLSAIRFMDVSLYIFGIAYYLNKSELIEMHYW
jgi:hypothetical protein